MKAFVFKPILFILMMVSSFALKTQAGDFDFEKVKVINRNFHVLQEDHLWISNQYGKIEVNTWSKPEFSITITIKAKANTEKTADETLNSIHINVSRTGLNTRVNTELDEMKQTEGWGFFGKSSHHFEVNYVINMPAQNALNINNKYGNTTLPDLCGPVNINDSYGNLTAGDLNNESNEINLRYGNAEIASLSRATLNFAYGNLKLGKSRDLTLTHKYGNLILGQVNKLNANIDYSGVKIESISGIAKLRLRYTGSFIVGTVSANAKLVDIDASYSSVVLPLDPSGGFDFSVSVNYGSFDYQKNSTSFLHNTNDDGHSEGSNSHRYQGHTGRGSGNSKIIVNSHYGDVKFY